MLDLLFEVLGPSDSIVAVAGEDIILPCYLKPNISAEDMTVDWLKLDFLDGRVFRYQNHRIIRDDQIPSYRRRTSLFEEELWRGNTSLKLTRVQGTDEGHYKCFIKAKRWYDDFTIQVLIKGEVYFHVNEKGLMDVTLDPDTSSPWVTLSEDRKQVRHGETRQDLPDNPERFDNTACVLGKEGFSSGSFYYEVQVKGKTWWKLGVVRESINKKGRITLSPDDGFWTVWLWNGEYKAATTPHVTLLLREKPLKVGVFVDYEKGQVSFYNVEARCHIYSFTGCTFTEKLYPFFNPGGSDSISLVVCPVDVILLLIPLHCPISNWFYSESTTNNYVRSPPSHRRTQPFFQPKIGVTKSTNRDKNNH
uniref:Butyrophilin subfamily 1 member A1-like n=1 Tax=Oncorhynchus tshawytscha TaxID=74940 RepID=A0A8C8MDD4_ONCTS